MKQSVEAEIQAFMDLYTQTWPFSGSILVAQKGEICFSKGYELASQEYSVPNTTQTKHRLCSITKQFTAMAILILQERGLLSVEDQAVRYLPDYKVLDERITIHHLLTHTSGLQYKFGVAFEALLEKTTRDSIMHSDVSPKARNRHETMFSVYRELPLLCEPGEAFNYSNFGYLLLACIIENVSGLTYESFFEQNIFKSLNMNHTGVERDKKIIKDLATGYYLNEDELIRFKYMNLDHAIGSGDIYSTVEDLYLWEQALSTEKLVSKDTLEKMFTPYACSGETTSETEDYGYGWFIDTKYDHNRISHGGGGLGFLTEFHRYPEEEISIIVLSNYGFTAVYKIAEILAAILFKVDYDFPRKPEAIELEAGEFEKWIGTYQNDIEKLTVQQVGDKISFVIDDTYIIPMYPISKSRFHHTWIDEAYTFYHDEAGDPCFIGAKKVKE